MRYLDNRKINMLHDIHKQYGQELVLLPEEIKNFSLLINCLLPVKVYLQGTASPLPNLLCPVTKQCRVCSSRTAEHWEAIIELQYGHVEKKLCKEKIRKIFV